jgi:metal-sulfur cluster biosynthetic enzyme
LVELAVSCEQVLDWLKDVPDPEIPVLTIADLGIVRGVTVNDGIVVELAPTYSGNEYCRPHGRRIGSVTRGATN